MFYSTVRGVRVNQLSRLVDRSNCIIGTTAREKSLQLMHRNSRKHVWLLHPCPNGENPPTVTSKRKHAEESSSSSSFILGCANACSIYSVYRSIRLDWMMSYSVTRVSKYRKLQEGGRALNAMFLQLLLIN